MYAKHKHWFFFIKLSKFKEHVNYNYKISIRGNILKIYKYQIVQY